MPRTAATNRSAASNRIKVQDIKSSLSFNGTSSYITPAIAPNITGFNFGMWVKINATATWQELVSCAGPAEAKGFILKRQPNGGIYVLLPHSGGGIRYIDFASSTSRKDGKWVHLVFTHVQGSQKAYVNGALVDSDTAIMIDQAGQAMYFCKSYQLTNFYSGLMSGVVFHNTTTPWTQAQITALYQNGTIPSGATCVLPLQEGAGTTAYDSSGNGNNGTITAGTFTSDVPTKKRRVVGGNLVYNGDFSYIPPVNVATTTNVRWIDGTAGGSTTNGLFGWGSEVVVGSGSFLFDTAVVYKGKPTMKLTTDAGAFIGANTVYIINPAYVARNGIPCLPNTSYTLTVAIKTNVLSGTATTGVYARISEYTGAGAGIISSDTSTITTTTDFTVYTRVFTTSATARYLVPKIYNRGNDGAATLAMEAWFADITLTPTTNTIRGITS